MQLEDLEKAVKNAEKLINLLQDIDAMQKPEEQFIPVSMEDRLLKIKECAKRLATTEKTVREYVNNGQLPALKIGDLKVRESTLMKFMAEQERIAMEQKEKELNKAC